MRATHRVGAAVVALVTSILLAGCLKLDADITVTSDDTVEGTFVIGVNKQLLTLTGQDEASITEQIQADLESDAPEQGSYTATPYTDETFVGATVTFSDVPLGEFDTPGTNGDGDLSISRDGDQYKVSGELDFEVSGLATDESTADIGALLEDSEPDLSIAISFPGRVTQANGSIDGCTVTWEPTLTEPTTFEATANSSGGCTESIKWWAWILIGLGVLVLIGAVVAIVRIIRFDKAKHRRPPTATPPAQAPPAETGPAETGADDVPPESTPLTMPPPEPLSPPDPPGEPTDGSALPPPSSQGLPPPEPKG